MLSLSMMWEGGVVAIVVMMVDRIIGKGFNSFGISVMDVMLLRVNLFMLLEILGALEGFATNLLQTSGEGQKHSVSGGM